MPVELLLEIINTRSPKATLQKSSLHARS
jgi:hypothetical protein